MLEPNFLLMDWTNQHCRAFPPPVSRRTPTEAVFDDNPRKNSLILAVHLWNPSGAEPTTIAEVLNRHKDVQYSSRIASHIARQQ